MTGPTVSTPAATANTMFRNCIDVASLCFGLLNANSLVASLDLPVWRFKTDRTRSQPEPRRLDPHAEPQRQREAGADQNDVHHRECGDKLERSAAEQRHDQRPQHL